MTETSGAANTILKILSGIQSGVEVSLASGEYSLGSSNDDDIQIIDVSLKARHLKLRISQGKIEIGAGSGSLRSANGVALDADSDWHEVEPLDVITAGTTRFALGPPTALWASIAEIDTGQQAAAPARKRAKSAPATDTSWMQRARKLAIPIAALVALAIFSAWQLSAARIDQFGFARNNGQSDLELTTAAVTQFPFARNVEVRQEVDGTIYVNGYVETPVERRAVAGAVEKTAIPARVRIWVLQSLRSEVESLAKSENLNITSTISSKGELTLEGVVLNEETTQKFVELVKDRILGIARIDTRIRTSKLLLAEIEKLAQVSQIHQFVLLRDNRELIEANGAIPVEKIDAWAGFLQAYAKRFAKDIGLRSYVQLQGVTMTAADQAFLIGGQKLLANDVALDVERLKQGHYAPKEVLVGSKDTAAPPQVEVQVASAEPVLRSLSGAANEVGPLLKDGARFGVTVAEAPEDPPTASVPVKPPEAPGRIAPRPESELTVRARKLLEEWRENGLRTKASDDAFRQALERLQSGEKDRLADRYLPLFNTRRPTSDAAASCWGEAHLTPGNLPAAIFWLDLLSVSEQLSLTTFDQDMQVLLLEAALNPKRAKLCAQKIAGGPAATEKSLYLTEVSRNPDFIRFIIRDLQPFTLDITGASIGQQARFIQIRSGRKLHEGAAPNRASRLASVGELGVAIQAKEGLSTIVFGQEMTWLAE